MIKVNVKELKTKASIIDKAKQIDKAVLVSSYIRLKTRNGRLYMHITNIDNHFEVGCPYTGEGEIDAVIQLELFTKYIAKLKDNADVVLEMVEVKTENNIKITQNKSVAYFQFADLSMGEVELFDIKNDEAEYYKVDSIPFFNSLKFLPSAVAEGYQTPEYSCFCYTDYTMSTNMHKICMLSNRVFSNTDMILIPYKLQKYFEAIPEVNDLEYKVTEDGIHLKSNTLDLYILGLPFDRPEIYKVDAIKELVLEKKMDAMIEISKAELEDVLERLSLFVNIESKNVVKLTFEKEHLLLNNLNSTSFETIDIKVKKASDIENYSVYVDLGYLKSLLSVIDTNEVTIQYTGQDFLRFDFGEVSQILALVEMELNE